MALFQQDWVEEDFDFQFLDAILMWRETIRGPSAFFFFLNKIIFNFMIDLDYKVEK